METTAAAPTLSKGQKEFIEREWRSHQLICPKPAGAEIRGYLTDAGDGKPYYAHWYCTGCRAVVVFPTAAFLDL
jgi:hypothetical protein